MHQITILKIILISSCSCFCPIHWSRVLSRERRCSWSSENRRFSKYIWVIHKYIVYWCAPYIRGLMVVRDVLTPPLSSLMSLEIVIITTSSATGDGKVGIMTINCYSITVKLHSGGCNRILLITNQHWFRQWLSVTKQQAITLTNVHQDLRCHMASQGHKELGRPNSNLFQH